MVLGDEDLFSLDIRLEEIKYDGFWDWFIQIHPITTLWNLQPTFILAQISFLLWGIAALIHALLNGGRWPHLWIASMLSGVLIESMCYMLPDVNNFWHSITPVMFIGRRLPLHVIFFYPSFYYQATLAATKLNLPQKLQPFAVGLFVVLLDIPYDIVSVKFVHWTWHDTDPNIYDRSYWVPWSCYFFLAAFAAGFTFWFNFSCDWRRSAGENLQLRRSAFAEWKSVACATLLGAPTGALFFTVIYHPLHDIFKIHSEVTFFILVSIFSLIVWRHFVTAGVAADSRSRTNYDKILIPHLLIHYGLFLGYTMLASPEKEISVGLHEAVGPCKEYESIKTSLGMVLKRKKYLCVEDYDEAYFDFHCIPAGPPSNNTVWYGICGTPFENRAEYVTILSLVALIASVLFYTLHTSHTRVECNDNKKKI